MFNGIKRDYKHYKHVKEVCNGEEYSLNRLESDIIVLVHSIEKGLSIDNPRKGFGIAKIKKLLQLMNKFVEEKTAKEECILMAISALKEYFEFEDGIKVDSQEYNENKNNYLLFLNNNNIALKDIDPSYGGTILINHQIKYNEAALLDILNNRHSIRDFKDEPVSINSIKSAIEEAQHAPSACNRQAVRVYIICGKQKEKLYGWLSGVGGFEKSTDKYLLITGKISAYNMMEFNQFIVSASIFAAYLTLTLQAKNIGACVIQRPLLYDDSWSNIAKEFDIPLDEQIVCAVGVGMLKDSYKVPRSHRYNIDKIMRVIDDEK